MCLTKRWYIRLFTRRTKRQNFIVERNDFGLIWLKLSNELFHFNKDVYLCFVYIPPTSSKVLKDKDFDVFEEVEKGLEKYIKMGKTYVTGDLNSRTAALSDILDFDAYLDTDHDDELQHVLNMSTLPLHQNQDTVSDSNGQKIISLCKSSGYIIGNGRLLNDKLGKYTFCSTRGLSVTDYLLIDIIDMHYKLAF